MIDSALLVLALLVPCPASASQSPATAASTAAGDVEKLRNSIEALARSGGSRVAVRVSEKDAPSVVGGVMVFDGGSQARKFAGDAELVQTPDGETLFVSTKSLPELSIYDDGARRVTRATTEDEPIDSADLCDDLFALCAWPALADALARSGAKLEAADGDGAKPSDEAGATKPAGEASSAIARWTASLPTRLVERARSGPERMMAPRVMAVRAEIGLGADGKLASARFEVVRSDPMAGLRERALSGSGTVAITPDELESDEPEEGATSVYEMRFSAEPPSKRAIATLSQMRELVR